MGTAPPIIRIGCRWPNPLARWTQPFPYGNRWQARVRAGTKGQTVDCGIAVVTELHRPIGGDGPNSIEGVDHENGTRVIDGQPRRVAQLGFGGGAAVSRRTEDSSTSHGGDDSFGSDPADAVPRLFRNVDVALAVDGQAGGLEEACLAGRTTVSLQVQVPASGEGGDHALWRDTADEATGFGDIEVVGGIDGEATQSL